MELSQVLLSPVVTEKSAGAQSKGKYVFMVHPDATKIDVKRAVKAMYDVDAVSMNLIPVLKKTRRGGRSKVITKRHTGKKMIVTLAPKQSLDFNKIKLT